MSLSQDEAKKMIKTYISDSANASESCKSFEPQLIEASKILAQSFLNGGKVLLAGNGGSAADCKHIAGEFLSLLRTTLPRKALPAISIPTDVPMLTASANDFDFVLTMARCVDAFAQKGDIFWGMSTSGASKNVIEAMKLAKARGMTIFAFTGKTGGAMKDYADVLFNVDHTDTPIIQQCHMMMAHMICEMVDLRLPTRGYLPQTKEQKSNQSMQSILEQLKQQ